MKRRLILFLLLVLLFAGGTWWWTARRASVSDTVAAKVVALAEKEGVTSFDGGKALPGGGADGIEANPLEKAVGLAIQGVNLFQGDKGLELWRLKASWAHLSQNGDTIDVDNPRVVYAMGDTGLPPSSRDDDGRENGDQDGETLQASGEDAPAGADAQTGADILNVTAKKGRVTDHQRHLTLWDDVIITRFGDTLTGPRMDYDSTTRTMTFPDGAALESERGHGTANVLHWDLARNVITGESGVEVILKPRLRTEASDPESGPSDQAPGRASANASENTPQKQ